MEDNRKETASNRIVGMKEVERLSEVRRSVFAASLLGLRRGGCVRRAGSGCVVSDSGRGRGRGRGNGGLSGCGSGLRLPKLLRQGFLRPGVLFLRYTPVQELYQERSYDPSSEDDENTGELCRLAIGKAEELSQVVQHPFTVRRRMTSGFKRAGNEEREAYLLPPGAKEVFHG